VLLADDRQVVLHYKREDQLLLEAANQGVLQRFSDEGFVRRRRHVLLRDGVSLLGVSRADGQAGLSQPSR
jgi:hypothetical protein